MSFVKTECLEKTEFNVFDEIGKKWLLITAYDEENSRFNVMTASWGCAGVLWNKPVCVLFVRPQRYTFSLLEKNETFSLNVLKNEYKGAHKVCGSLSGRDNDKITMTGLTPANVEGHEGFEESETVLTLKKLYADDLKESKFIDKSLLSHYDRDYHRVYVCEIIGLYRNMQN